ncbi:MAG TPA: hypothetical protein VFH94_17570 [Streptomyces sp.]|nr:hypothetical protein [Streptomyces sp.]
MTSFITSTKVTDRSVVATCPLGSSLRGTGLSGIAAFSPEVFSPAGVVLAELPVRERNERPTKAPEAAAAVAQAHAYVSAAAGAGSKKQTTQHHTMWAFRGPEPWSDPA